MPTEKTPSAAGFRSTETTRRVAALAQDAAQRIRAVLDPTPARGALGLDPAGQLILKLESFQPTGSFKVRGATYRISALTESERRAGVVAASTGNHGAAVAYAASLAGVEATVVVPEPTPDSRVRAIEARGAKVLRHGPECGVAEGHARALGESSGRVFLSPYNDELVMGGQGSIGIELLDQVADLQRVYVAVGGGGLIGGVACAVKEARPGVEIIGASPRASCPMHASVQGGRVVETEHRETLSIATAGGLEDAAVTLQPCMDAVDRWELVDEEDIGRGVYDLLVHERLLAEGAVGVALAAWRRDREAGLATGPSVVIVCGGNLDVCHLTSILRRYP